MTTTPCNCEQALALAAQLEAARQERDEAAFDRDRYKSVIDTANTTATQSMNQASRMMEQRDAARQEVAVLSRERGRLPSEALWTDYLRRVTVAEAEAVALTAERDAVLRQLHGMLHRSRLRAERDAARQEVVMLRGVLADTPERRRQLHPIVFGATASNPFGYEARLERIGHLLAALREASRCPAGDGGGR